MLDVPFYMFLGCFVMYGVSSWWQMQVGDRFHAGWTAFRWFLVWSFLVVCWWYWPLLMRLGPDPNHPNQPTAVDKFVQEHRPK